MAELRAAFIRFLEEGTPESYSAVRQLLGSHPKYDPYGEMLSDVEDLVETGDLSLALARFKELFIGFLLTPSFHLLWSAVYKKLGDAEGAEAERAIAFRCMDGLIGTGDGTPEKPYQVTRSDDAYDVLNYLKKTPASQALIERAGRHFDFFKLTDGSELWFDITLQYSKLNRMFSDPNDSGPAGRKPKT